MERSSNSGVLSLKDTKSLWCVRQTSGERVRPTVSTPGSVSCARQDGARLGDRGFPPVPWDSHALRFDEMADASGFSKVRAQRASAFTRVGAVARIREWRQSGDALRSVACVSTPRIRPAWLTAHPEPREQGGHRVRRPITWTIYDRSCFLFQPGARVLNLLSSPRSRSRRPHFAHADTTSTSS